MASNTITKKPRFIIIAGKSSFINNISYTTYKSRRQPFNLYEFLKSFKATLTTQLTSALATHTGIKAKLNVKILYWIKDWHSTKNYQTLESIYFQLHSIEAIPSFIKELYNDIYWRDDWYQDTYNERIKKIDKIMLQTTKFFPNELNSSESQSVNDKGIEGGDESDDSSGGEDESIFLSGKQNITIAGEEVEDSDEDEESDEEPCHVS